MRLISDWLKDAPVPGPDAVLTIGVFDGLHRGHQYLINEVIQRARDLEVNSLLLTFEPHPLSVLSHKYAPDILTTFGQKKEVLEGMGLDILGCLRFNEALAKTSAEDFLNSVVSPSVQPTEILIGSDFHFGRNAEGSLSLLSSWAKKRGIGLTAVDIQYSSGGEIFASSHVRGLLKMGHVESAAKLLGRPYRLTGEVITGQKRGRTLGFPTANLGKVGQLIPGPGVYAVKAILRGVERSAMTSIGNNPTFKGQYLTVETYIFDFEGEFYGEELSLDFMRRIRGMIRFDSAAALTLQLKADEKQARAFLTD
ncbi:MAG: bifunctional riboflavin kinase/FAD synthetase [Deltaproteobacteria bacterium]|jgi:riboflavin kinase/FMN adenylyltransferase|nr:bifunctional riboflavin kinase/FAD synthetase [Deltaproteobacteria bacterium]